MIYGYDEGSRECDSPNDPPCELRTECLIESVRISTGKVLRLGEDENRTCGDKNSNFPFLRLLNTFAARKWTLF